MVGNTKYPDRRIEFVLFVGPLLLNIRQVAIFICSHELDLGSKTVYAESKNSLWLLPLFWQLVLCTVTLFEAGNCGV